MALTSKGDEAKLVTNQPAAVPRPHSALRDPLAPESRSFTVCPRRLLAKGKYKRIRVHPCAFASSVWGQVFPSSREFTARTSFDGHSPRH